MNRFDELIQVLKDNSAAQPAADDHERMSDAAKPELPDQHAEHCFRLPYSSNPRPIGMRWK